MKATSVSPLYQFLLYVTGTSPRSARAIVNVRRICEQHLHDRYELKVIDIAGQPALARSQQLIAAPTLVKQRPLPERRFIGDMSRSERLVAALDLASPAAATPPK
jgi:circadian clock protein KaiB